MEGEKIPVPKVFQQLLLSQKLPSRPPARLPACPRHVTDLSSEVFRLIHAPSISPPHLANPFFYSPRPSAAWFLGENGNHVLRPPDLIWDLGSKIKIAKKQRESISLSRSL